MNILLEGLVTTECYRAQHLPAEKQNVSVIYTLSLQTS